MDFCAALCGLAVLSPLILIVAAILFITNDGKVFFVQERPGKDGKIFRLIKFKTMNDRKDIYGCLLPDVERITGTGKFLRNTSFDEIPQLFNVLKGEMSLVGPRPLLPEYLPLYSDFQKRRHEVLPGITGWAQVNGRNAISWKQKFEYDVWYVDNLSFRTDFKIILLTINKVFAGKGINAGKDVTMEFFTGND
ncbi:MAG: sugar transferase [Dysgonamonadaceae bacterium]|jgi:lipopolysaccharide/colanic/teichoic acid biosynthesis glycosyltransferase|nr:sugar transferase [Dysgonamonadaceae bacterium]